MSLIKNKKNCANKLVNFYPADLESTLVCGLEQFIPFLKFEHKNEEKHCLLEEY